MIPGKRRLPLVETVVLQTRGEAVATRRRRIHSTGVIPPTPQSGHFLGLGEHDTLWKPPRLQVFYFKIFVEFTKTEN